MKASYRDVVESIPNTLTLSRLLGVGPVIWLHALDHPKAGWFLLGILATDMEGGFARLFNAESEFGRIFDPLTDFLAMSALYIYMLVSADIGLFWKVLVTLVLTRSIFVVVHNTRIMKTGRKMYVTWSGKGAMALMMTSVILFFFNEQTLFHLSLLLGVTLSLYSMTEYIKLGSQLPAPS